MKLFLDTSVLLAGSGSGAGASREIFRLAPAHEWELLATPYVIAEVDANIGKLPASASSEWTNIRGQLSLVEDVLVSDRPVVFEPTKDRPILFSALAWADALLTLDRADFGALMGTTFYGLKILTPGQFLAAERASGRLR